MVWWPPLLPQANTPPTYMAINICCKKSHVFAPSKITTNSAQESYDGTEQVLCHHIITHSPLCNPSIH